MKKREIELEVKHAEVHNYLVVKNHVPKVTFIDCIARFHHRSPAINCLINMGGNLLYLSAKFLLNSIPAGKKNIYI